MNWISVKEKLPEKDQQVLACGKFEDEDCNSIKTCSYETGLLNKRIMEWIFSYHCCPQKLTNVTHWMPLPEAPKGNNEVD